MVKDAPVQRVAGRRRGGMESSAQSSPSASGNGSSVREMSAETNTSVTPPQVVVRNAGRGSAAAVIAETAPKNGKAVETLSSADQSPSSDDFQALSRGRQNINVQRQLLESIHEDEGGSSLSLLKSLSTAQARQKLAPCRSAPAQASQGLPTDEQTQDVSGQQEAPFMKFRVGARAQPVRPMRASLAWCMHVCAVGRGVCV